MKKKNKQIIAFLPAAKINARQTKQQQNPFTSR